MKLKYYFISLLAACVLLSCSKDDGDGGETPVTPTETTLSILVNPSTKADVVDPQDIISDLTVLLFIDDELYKKETKTGDNVQEITDIPVKPGNMKALLLANISK